MILNFKISVECLILWNYGSFHDIRKVRTCNYTYQVTRILPASFRISTSCKQRRIGHLFDSINFKKVEFRQQSTRNMMFHFWKLTSVVNFVEYKESWCIRRIINGVVWMTSSSWTWKTIHPFSLFVSGRCKKTHYASRETCSARYHH